MGGRREGRQVRKGAASARAFLVPPRTPHTEFCSGVPVMAQRRSALSAYAALAICVLVFLMCVSLVRARVQPVHLQACQAQAGGGCSRPSSPQGLPLAACLSTQHMAPPILRTPLCGLSSCARMLCVVSTTAGGGGITQSRSR